jgi:hypothetical protein
LKATQSAVAHTTLRSPNTGHMCLLVYLDILI